LLYIVNHSFQFLYMFLLIAELRTLFLSDLYLCTFITVILNDICLICGLLLLLYRSVDLSSLCICQNIVFKIILNCIVISEIFKGFRIIYFVD
jgi:hypothetical protein